MYYIGTYVPHLPQSNGPILTKLGTLLLDTLKGL